MAGKPGNKKKGKKPKGPNRGPMQGPNREPMQGQNGGDDVSTMDDAILAEVIATSQKDADMASIEESALSEAIAASLELANANANKSTPNNTAALDGAAGDADTAPKPPTDEESNDTLLKDTLGDNDDDEVQLEAGIENCPHLKDAVKLSKIRKTLTATHPVPADLDHCHGCRDQHAKFTSIAQQLGVPLSVLALSDPIDDMLEPLPLDALWLCLACSEINCGRMFKKHGVAHHNKVTNNHPLAMNLGSMDIWCYECDDQVVTSKDKNPILQECQALLARTLQAKQAKAREGLLAQSRKGKGHKDSKVKVYTPGLQNLGNTCFFNSVMQVLVETKSLREILSENNSHSSKSISATTRTGLGPLTTNFKDFLFTMWKQQGGTVTPRDLFMQIAKKWKIFRGFREQDSQELMRHLLEGIRQEETALIKKRLAEEEQQQQVGEEVKSEVAAPPKYVPFIDTCFSGKLVSVIVCDACKKCSYAYENYYDLSLPIKGASVSIGSGSLVDRLKAKSRATGYELTRSSDSSDGQGILEADQGSEEHWRHVEKLLKNVPSRSPNSEALSIERSLIQFTNVDLLDGENKFACENCYRLVESYKAQDGTTVEEDGAAEKGEKELKEVKEEEKEEEEVKEVKEEKEVKEVKEEKEEKEVEEKKKDEKTETKDSTATDRKPKASNAILRRAYKRYLVSSLPSTLVLHLKRFEHTTTSFGLMKKIEDHVDVPTELDMAPFCIPKSELYDETETEVKELAAADNFESGEKGSGSTKYKLYGATVHQGSLATGHYTNFVLSSKVEVPPTPVLTEPGKPSTTTTAVSNGVGVVLPDIPLSDILAQQSSKKKKKKGGGGGGGGAAVAAAKKGAAAGGSNGAIPPTVVSLESTTAERTVNDDDGLTKMGGVIPESVKDTREWIYCSDTQVRSATLDEVLASRPYLLYYERC